MHIYLIPNSQPNQFSNSDADANRISGVMICVPARSGMRGGAYSVAEDIAWEITRRNIRVYFASFNTQILMIQDYTTKRFVTHSLRFRYAAIGILVLYLKSLRINILHCHLDVAFIAASSASLAGIPSVRTIHGRLNRPGMLAWQEKIAFRLAVSVLQQRIIAVSNQVMVDIVNAYNLSPQINVFEIPNGVYLNLPQSQEYTSQKQLTFIFVGRFEKFKGFKELISAFTKVYSQYPHIQLHLVGDGQEKHLIDPQLVASGAIIVSEGWQPRSIVREYIRSSHIFCSTFT